MKIGIDLDGVIFDSEKEFRIYSELYDILELKKNSKIDNSQLKFQERFNWTDEENEAFLNKYHSKIILESHLMPGAKEVLKLLKKEGHELIIITARGCRNEEAIEITERRLKENDLEIFEKIYYSTENKAEVCLKEHIDIMIDDYYEKCQSIANARVKTIYLKDAPSYNLEENEYIKVLYNWGEIYRYIKEFEAK